MTFVVTEPCIGCKYTDCVAVCPMECFFAGPNFIAIHPDECIDCSMCVAECPVGAIVGDRELLPEQQHYLALNRKLVSSPGWQRTSARQSPLPEHAKWAVVTDKLDTLKR